ncbi:MAG: hypothetical protein ABFS42_15330, partial [Candidatus Krumholzibacteriota bacterium]
QEVPESVERIIGKALAKDRGNRYADAAELLVDLDLVIAGEAVKGRRLEKRRRGPIAGAAAAVIGMILVALFVWPGFLVPSDAISVLAVMPLEDRSDDPDHAYFADGVADELAIGLQKIGALTIISRSSASHAREIFETNREIGDQLGVDALIEGSVQRDGDRVRVSVQLVATDNDRLLWSESYTRDLRDILNLQSEIALAVSSALETELTPGEEESLSRDRQIDPEAFEEYLLGKHFYNLATAEGTELALKHFDRALAIEPDWAMAHIKMADSYHLNQQMAGLPVSAVSEKIMRHERRAIELEPDSAISQDLLGSRAWNTDWDLPAAGEFFARAREIDPNMDMMGYAQYLNVVGRHQEALVQAKHAARVDPLNGFYQANLAARYHQAGQSEKALAEIARLHEREPDNWVSLWIQGSIYIDQGKPADAVEPLRRAVVHSGNALAVKPVYAYSLLLSGRQEEAAAILDTLETMAEEDYLQPFYLGLIYAAFGRNDEAFAAFDRAIEERDWLMFWISPPLTPTTRGLVSDPRWPELLGRIGLPVD